MVITDEIPNFAADVGVLLRIVVFRALVFLFIAVGIRHVIFHSIFHSIFLVRPLVVINLLRVCICIVIHKVSRRACDAVVVSSTSFARVAGGRGAGAGGGQSWGSHVPTAWSLGGRAGRVIARFGLVVFLVRGGRARRAHYRVGRVARGAGPDVGVRRGIAIEGIDRRRATRLRLWRSREVCVETRHCGCAEMRRDGKAAATWEASTTIAANSDVEGERGWK